MNPSKQTARDGQKDGTNMDNSLLDVESIKDTIRSGGEFRVHLVTAKSGLCCKARIWHVDGFQVGRANGGGYDKQGAALGDAVNLFFAEELNKLESYNSNTKDGLYGLVDMAHMGNKVDGACGIESVERILTALGFKVRIFDTGKLTSMVLAERAPQKGGR